MTATLVLLFALGQLAAPQLAQPGTTDVLRADTVEVEDGQLHAEGGVQLRSGGILLRAGDVDYDLETREGSAGGGLLLIDGAVVLRAREGVFSLSDRTLALDDALLLQKSAPLPLEQSEALDFDRLRALGRNSLVLRAGHIERRADREFVARHVLMTACDCGEGPPDWEIAASRADVAPGERAILFWPVFYILDTVPVPLPPVLYVPLSSRRTGLLFPQFGSNSYSGYFIDEPLFITLGESWDTTITGGYSFGNSILGGIRGLRLADEVRYAPAQGTSGRLQLNGYDDRTPDPGGPARGWRGGLAWRHGTTTGGLELQSDVNLVSDTHLPRDTQPYIAVPYLRSQTRIAVRGADALFEVNSAYYQPLAVYDAAGTQVPERLLLFRGAGAGQPVQRPLALLYDVPSTQIGGGVRAGLAVTGALLAPIAVRDQTLDSASRGLARIDLRPQLARALTTGIVESEVYAGAQGDVTSYPALSPGAAAVTAPWARVYAGAQANTLLIRALGDGPAALRNTLEPRLEVRAISRSANRPVAPLAAPRDEFDFGTFDAMQVQTVASLTSRLLTASGSDVARLVIGQDAELRSATLGDTFASLDTHLGPVSASAGARFDPRHFVLPLFLAAASIGNGQGTSFSTSYVLSQSATGTDRTRAGVIDLFQVAQENFMKAVYDQLNFQAAWRPFHWLSLLYGSSLNPTGREPGLRKFLVHSAGVGLTSGCDCWNLNVVTTFTRGGGWSPQFSLLLDLKDLGSFGSARH